MPKQTDPEVIRKAMAGNEGAFRELVEEHQGFSYSLAYRFVGNAAEAEDITQEAFIRLWKYLPRYRLEIKLTTWLYKIIANLCLDYLKSRHAKRQKSMQDIDSHYAILDHTSSDGSLLAIELRLVVLKMAESLTPKQKAVFVLRDLEELTVQEVCEALSMSASKVKSNLYYARIKMSELLNAYNRLPKTELQ